MLIARLKSLSRKVDKKNAALQSEMGEVKTVRIPRLESDECRLPERLTSVHNREQKPFRITDFARRNTAVVCGRYRR